MGLVIGYLRSGVVENLSANCQIVIEVGGLAPLFRHHFWLGGVIGKSDVGLSGVSLSFAGSISFEPGRDHQCAVGRKVGWGVDAATTGVLNNNQGVSDPLITIRSIWNNRNLYVNGVK